MAQAQHQRRDGQRRDGQHEAAPELLDRCEVEPLLLARSPPLARLRCHGVPSPDGCLRSWGMRAVQGHVQLVAVAAVVADRRARAGRRRSGSSRSKASTGSPSSTSRWWARSASAASARTVCSAVSTARPYSRREQLVERPAEVVAGRGRAAGGGVPPGLERHRLARRRSAPARPARPSARRSRPNHAATSAGGATASTRTTRVDGVFPRRRMSWVNEARCRWDCTAGSRDEGALALHPAQRTLGDERLDGAAHGGARDGVRLHQLALGGDRRCRGEVGGGHRGQHGAQLHVLGLGAVGDPEAVATSSGTSSPSPRWS